MGKIVAVAEAKTKKKKKGRPSLVDLQKRSLLQQQQQQEEEEQQQARKRNPNPSPNSNQAPNYTNSRSRSPASKPDPIPRRVTRRQASQIQKKDEGEVEEAAEDDDDEDDDDEDDEEKKQKKLKLVLRLPRSFHPCSPSSLEGLRDRGDAEASGSAASDDESENGEKPLKKRKIDAVSESKKAAVCNGSAGDAGRCPGFATGKEDKKKNDQKGVDPTPAAAPSGSTTGTPLPNIKLLLFILERLQKKDTYGVFSEPVDPEELPDYHDIIEHPMDFSTIRKKLSTGVYITLEAFESDVFLICSNAMHYNAPETIYFRQARAIQELAKKNFQNLRQDGHGTEQDVRPQRGRPSLVKKFLRQSAGKQSFEPAGSDSDAALANAGENSPWSNDAKKKTAGPEKPSSLPDTYIKASVGLRNGDSSTSLADNKYEKTEEASCINHRGMNLKQARKPNISDENRRATYKLSTQLAGRPDPVFSILDAEKKQLLPVGVHVEHAYARSLARFAATLGPVAWRVAVRKIERVLPPGMKFGPGWVGEAEAPPSVKSLVESTPAAPTVDARSNAPPVTAPIVTTVDVRCNVPPVTAPAVDARCNVPPVTAPTVDARCNVSGTQESLKAPVPEGHPNQKVPPPHLFANRMVDAKEGFGNPRMLSKENTKTSFNPAVHGARFPFQHHQNVGAQQSLNGFTGGYPMPHLAKQAQGSPVLPVLRPTRQQESTGVPNLKPGMEAMSSHLLNMVNRSNIIQAPQSKQLEVEQFRPPADRKARIDSLENSKPENAVSAADHQVVSGNSARLQASWRGLSLQQKLDTTPPDLNIGFQPPGSPVRQNSGVLTDTQQPDLALQL